MRTARIGWAVLCVAGLLCSCLDLAASDYAIGADVSFLRAAEKSGTVFKDSGQAKAGLAILKDHGYTWVRLRLVSHPTDLPNNLEYTIASAKAAKELGLSSSARSSLLGHVGRSWKTVHSESLGRVAAWAVQKRCVRVYEGDHRGFQGRRAFFPIWCRSAMKSSMACCGPTAVCRTTGTILRI